MATSNDYAAYVKDTLSKCGTIVVRKMFGEYGIYLDGIFFGLICDNNLYVKVTEYGKKENSFPLASPYEGAKPYYLIEDIENPSLTIFLLETCKELQCKK